MNYVSTATHPDNLETLRKAIEEYAAACDVFIRAGHPSKPDEFRIIQFGSELLFANDDDDPMCLFDKALRKFLEVLEKQDSRFIAGPLVEGYRELQQAALRYRYARETQDQILLIRCRRSEGILADDIQTYDGSPPRGKLLHKRGAMHLKGALKAFTTLALDARNEFLQTINSFQQEMLAWIAEYREYEARHGS